MTKERLAHEESSTYGLAHRLYERVLAIANTENRLTNERLEAQAFRLLMHAAAMATEATRPARARRIQYTRLALARLAATLDAAWSGRHVSDKQRTEVRAELLRLDDELEKTIKHPTNEPAPSLEIAEGDSAATAMTIEELIELHHLVERDARRADSLDGAAGTGPGS